jgi:hypothetical protein
LENAFGEEPGLFPPPDDPDFHPGTSFELPDESTAIGRLAQRAGTHGPDTADAQGGGFPHEHFQSVGGLEERSLPQAAETEHLGA